MTHSHCLFLETHRLDGCDHIPSNWCSMRMAHWMAHSSGKPNNKPSQLFPEVVMQCTPSLHEGISLDLQYMDLPRFTTISHNFCIHQWMLLGSLARHMVVDVDNWRRKASGSEALDDGVHVSPQGVCGPIHSLPSWISVCHYLPLGSSCWTILWILW